MFLTLIPIHMKIGEKELRGRSGVCAISGVCATTLDLPKLASLTMNAQSGDTFRNPRHITLESESMVTFLKPRYAFSHYSSASRLFYRDFIRIKGSHPTLSYSSLGIGCQNELFFLCGSDCFAYCSSFFKQAVIVYIIVDVLGTD